MFTQTKHTLKRLRYAMRRMRAARRWGADRLDAMPAVLGNAMPKSGSHLLTQVLSGLAELGPFVDPGFPPVNRGEDNRKLTDAAVLRAVNGMLPGEIRYGYLHAAPPWVPTVTGPGRATVFIYRDPRDWVVSQVFYATDMHEGHMLHDYYNSLNTIEARINAAIEGVDVPGVRAPSVAERYGHYLGWLEVPGVLCVKFEDLIENRKPVLSGAKDRKSAIGDILDYLETFNFKPSTPRTEAIAILERGIAPGKSGTFRRGTPGEWKEQFTEENRRRFERVAGDLARKLGYVDL
jgi:hypothetical protein